MPEHRPAPVVRPVTVTDIPAIREILFAALDAGELSGTTRRALDREIELARVMPGGMLVSLAGDEVAGFFDPGYPLLAVHPRHRRQRHGTRLVERAQDEARERGANEVELAPPAGDGPAEAFAASLGFTYRSSLWQMRLDPETTVQPTSFPDGFAARVFQPGSDDEQYVALLNTCFADHPSPLNLSLDIVRHAHARPNFDPANIAIVPDPDDPARLIAFCRTTLDIDDAELHAEIAHLGVLPEFRGRGLGRELLRWGIHHLRSRGAAGVYLAVEGSNQHALGLYERTGFIQVQEWPRWVASGPFHHP
jgi:mycothiol synthase